MNSNEEVDALLRQLRWDFWHVPMHELEEKCFAKFEKAMFDHGYRRVDDEDGYLVWEKTGPDVSSTPSQASPQEQAEDRVP